MNCPEGASRARATKMARLGKNLPRRGSDPIYIALRIRAESAGRSKVSDANVKTVGRRLAARAGCWPAGLVAFLVSGHSVRTGGSLAETKQAISRTCAGGHLNRSVGAEYAPLEWRRGELRPGFWLTMSCPHNCSFPTATIAACGAAAPHRLSVGAPKAPFLSSYFPPISNTDAARGSIERLLGPSACSGARRKRVLHGKQDDHRRLSPGRNPGGGAQR